MRHQALTSLNHVGEPLSNYRIYRPGRKIPGEGERGAALLLTSVLQTSRAMAVYDRGLAVVS